MPRFPSGEKEFYDRIHADLAADGLAHTISGTMTVGEFGRAALRPWASGFSASSRSRSSEIRTGRDECSQNAHERLVTRRQQSSERITSGRGKSAQHRTIRDGARLEQITRLELVMIRSGVRFPSPAPQPPVHRVNLRSPATIRSATCLDSWLPSFSTGSGLSGSVCRRQRGGVVGG